MESLDELSEESWDLVLDVNLKGMFLVTQEINPAIEAAGGGAIVNLSTVESQVVVSSSGLLSGPLQRLEGGRAEPDQGAGGRTRAQRTSGSTPWRPVRSLPTSCRWKA